MGLGAVRMRAPHDSLPTPSRATALRSFAVALAVTLASSTAAAQSCPPPVVGARPALCRNNFAIDLYQGPVLAPLRVMAVGGAYAALANGVDGLGQNTASAAVRLPYSFGMLDYDLTLSLSLPGAFGKTDFDNRGEVGLNSVTFFYTLGLQLQWGDWGFATLADVQRYTLAPQPNSNLPAAAVQVGRIRTAVGTLLLDNQATLGLGVRAVRATVDALDSASRVGQLFPASSTNLLTMTGFSPEVGLVVHPDYAPWRLGVTYRFPVSASGTPSTPASVDSDGVRRLVGLALPDHVELPWELEAGVALSAGSRPLNPRWIDPRDHERQARRTIADARRARQQAQATELALLADPAERARREQELQQAERYQLDTEEQRLRDLLRLLDEERRARYKNWPRARILILADALITGTTDGGIGLQSFLRQEDVTSGDRVSVQPRLGLEGEPIPYRMMARVGTYIEPSRYRQSPSPGVLAGTRQHFTFGLEVRTFSTELFGIIRRTDFTINLAGDLAPRYQNVGVSIGTWH